MTNPIMRPFRRIWCRWMRAADWLGARRPLDLVCGMMLMIVVLRALYQLIAGR